MKKPLTTEEVYFLVRVGSWDQAQLEAWVRERIDEEQVAQEFNIKEEWNDYVGWKTRYE